MPDHLSRQRLLQYIDGELAGRAMRDTQDHLSACWTCQAELERIKEQIGLILSAQTDVLDPSLPPPPNVWPRLEPRLRAVADVPAPRWKQFFKLPVSLFRTPLAYGGALAVLIATLLWAPASQLSAKEVIQKVNAADRQRLAVKSHQLVKQRIRVKKTIRNDGNEVAESDVWKSSASATYWCDGLDALRARYASNGVSSELPLSGAAVNSWMALAEDVPSVSRQGNETEVRASANAEGRSRGLEGIRFRVGQDWHIGTLILSFDDETFEIVEGQTSVLDQSEVPASVLAQLAPSRTGQVVTLPTTVPANSLLPPAQENVPSTPDPNDVEMGVRLILHELRADLGEGVEIVSRPPGLLTVNAWSASPELKNQLMAALGNKPEVQLILTAPAGTAPVRTRRIVATETSPQPIRDPRLTKVFGTGFAQENYTRNLLQGGTIALSHWYALQDLANRWPSDSQLSPSARAQLNTMLQDHAKELRKGVTVWHTDIQSLLTGLGYAVMPVGGASPESSDWRQVTARGLDAARHADSTIRSLLTVSDQPIVLDQALPRLQIEIADLEQSTQSLSASILR